MQDVAPVLDERPVCMAADDEPNARRHSDSRGIVHNHRPQLACREKRRIRKVGARHGAVGVATHSYHRRDGLQRKQDVWATDIACVHDDVDPLERVWNPRVEYAMRIGYDSDACRKIKMHATDPALS